MKKLVLLLIAATAGFPSLVTAAESPVVRIELTPKGWFAKPQTFLVPVSADGSATETRSGIEQTFYFVQSESSNNGATETEHVADKKFFGVIATVSNKNGRMDVSLTFRKLLAISSSADGLSTYPQTSEAKFQSSFSGTSLEVKLPGSDDFKRVRFTVL